MAILYLKILLLMPAAISLFTGILIGVIFFIIGQCNRGQFTTAIKTVYPNTYTGYQIDRR
jgi:xanthine/uracil/vitamin C permease (AzgA family)